MTQQERIKADAQKAVKVKNWGESLQIEMYIAGATAEHDRAQPVIDAAEKIAKMFAHKGDHQPCAICQLTNALQQWKGEKEGECTCSLSRIVTHGRCYKCPEKTNPQK